MLHFFTTWSLAAQVDVAELRRARDAMPPGSTMIVGIGLDPDGPRLVRPWRKAVGADWPITLPSDELAAGQSGLGRIRVVPTTVVLDGGGGLHLRFIRSADAQAEIIARFLPVETKIREAAATAPLAAPPPRKGASYAASEEEDARVLRAVRQLRLDCLHRRADQALLDNGLG